MKNLKLGLAVIVITLFYLQIPPVHALNCTSYDDEQRELCNSVDSLDLSNKDKLVLMQSDAYDSFTSEQEPINLSLNVSSQEIKSTEQIYEENISIVVKILTFLALNYSIFSFLTKPQRVIRWLTAGC